MFGASQLWGKIGRAFLRSLSERQYIRNPRSDPNKALVKSLEDWKWLIQHGSSRPIIAAPSFKSGCQPLQFGREVPQSLKDQWPPRKSQIAMVELFATLVALETFRELICDSPPLLFVDSESWQFKV